MAKNDDKRFDLDIAEKNVVSIMELTSDLYECLGNGLALDTDINEDVTRKPFELDVEQTEEIVDKINSILVDVTRSLLHNISTITINNTKVKMNHNLEDDIEDLKEVIDILKELT